MTQAFSVRPARPGDEVALFELVKALSVYEKLSHKVTGTSAQLGKDLFGEGPSIEALLAEVEGKAVGFALFFGNYSTFLTRPGVYLEDLFVLQEYRRFGIGRALLAAVKELAQARGAGRLEWSVLNWNQSAIDFYQAFGAEVLPDWRICRVIL